MILVTAFPCKENFKENNALTENNIKRTFAPDGQRIWSLLTEVAMLHFNDFRDGEGGELCRRLGIDISACETWSEFTSAMVRFNNKTDGGLVEAARHLDGVASTGERALLHAVLSAADFSKLADELSGGTTWVRSDYVFGTYRLALAACVARLDRGRDRLAPGVADGDASRSRHFFKARQGDGAAV